MQAFLYRIFNVRSGELGLVLVMSLLLLGNTVARQMSGIVGISDLINTGGVNQTLLVNLINGFLILLTALLISQIVDRFNRIELLKWTSFSFAMVFLLLRVVSMFNVSVKFTAALIYLMSQQQWLVFPMFFWVLANDIFEVSQAKRLIPVIGSWSFVGKLIGIGLTLLPALFFRLGWLSNGELTLEMVMLANVTFYLLAFLLISVQLKNIKMREASKETPSVRENLNEGWQFIREVPSFSYLLMAVIAVSACDVILEFRFFAAAKGEIPDTIQYKEFYSWYLLIAAVVSFLIQSFVTGRLMQRIQIKNSFLIQPLIALGATSAMLASPGLISASISSLVLKISRNTVDEATRKAYQGFVPEERRGRVALFTDNYAPALGMILASALTGLVIIIGQQMAFNLVFYFYLGISAIASLFALWAVLRLRKVYESSFMNWRLKRRKRAVEVLKKLEF
ncbi:MAG: hypothetical protein HUU38_07495 [Anaerolineales bacterium]|nr:hypothetical protein [Anaerolineales bacterium]